MTFEEPDPTFIISMKKLATRFCWNGSVLPAIALAEILDYPKDIVGTPEKIESLFNNVADWFFTIFLIVAVMAIIYTAFIYLTSTGDPTKIKRARTSLTFAIVAIAIAILAAGAPTLIENLLREGAGGDSGDSGSDFLNNPPLDY